MGNVAQKVACLSLNLYTETGYRQKNGCALLLKSGMPFPTTETNKVIIGRKWVGNGGMQQCLNVGR